MIIRPKPAILLRACLWAFLAGVTGLAHASQTQPPATESSIDDASAIFGEELSVQCDICRTNSDFSAKALATYPRASQSTAYVFNLMTGEIRSVALDYDWELRRQLGGQVDIVDPLLQAYVRNAGEMYRLNGSSLAFKVILRADGSAYWKPANGAAVEIADVGLRRFGLSTKSSFPAKDGLPPSPGVGSPIDLRGYQFPPGFGITYPNFPPTSYDAAFGRAIDAFAFARDQLSHFNGSNRSGIFNGTQQAAASPGISTPIVSVSGGTTVSRTMTSRVGIYLPLRDGGYMVLAYDVQMGTFEVKEVYDSQGKALPPGNGNAQTFLANNTLNFAPGPAGQRGLDALLDWATRNGISVVNSSPGSPGGASTQCHSAIEGGVMVVTCRLRN